MSGLSTIRAFQAEKLLQEEFENHQDLNSGTWFMFIGNFNTNNIAIKTNLFILYVLGTSTGFGMSLDLLVYIFIGCVIYFFVLMNEGLKNSFSRVLFYKKCNYYLC